MTDLKAHDAKLRDGAELEGLDSEVYQECILTRQYLYPVCLPIYEFNCVYEALTGIADCIRGELSRSSIFTISYYRGWL